MLVAGDTCPDFTLPLDSDAIDLGTFSVADHRGKNMVVFFFPRADTSGCTKEAMGFSSLQAGFDAANTLVIGVSKDTPQKMAKFRAKYDLTCLLGSDHETTICEQFDVWGEKSMYGKKYMGISRATFLIDSNGKIMYVWPKVNVSGHAEDVLSHLQAGG